MGLALVLLLLQEPAVQEAERPAAPPDERLRYDVLAYHLALEVLPDSRTLRGEVTVTAQVAAEELLHVWLDLDGELEIAEVRHGDAKLGFGHLGDRLITELPAPLAKGEEFSITVAYSGHPRAEDEFSGFHWAQSGDGRPWINTSCQGPGSRSWWPCKDSYFHPEDKPQRVSMDLTVPAGLYGVSNGRLHGRTQHDDGRETFHWIHPYPLETYSVTLNVAPYVVVESQLQPPGHGRPFPFVYYVLPENKDKAAVQFSEVPRLLEIYCEAFGPFPFPESKFALVETNFWGMEHSTAVAYGSSFPKWCAATGAADRYAQRNRWFDYILVHEVAHEWWGNAVSAAAWGHFWIHEGFGTYAEGVYVERTQGRARADQFFQEMASGVGRRSRLFRGHGVDSGQAYSGVIYSKGACVLNTLRHYLDDDAAWWAALRDFNLRFRYGNAATEDFRAVLEERSGRSWEQFFDEWFYGEGWPLLSGTVRALDGGGIAVELRNEGSADTLFTVPLDLSWSDGEGERSLRLDVPPGELAAELPISGPVRDLRVVNLQRLLGRHQVSVIGS